MCLFVIIRFRGFREIFCSDNYSKKGYLIVFIVFFIFVIIVNYIGFNVEGFLVNVWIIIIVFGGIIFGLVVGIVVGVIFGVYRYLIDIGGIILILCFISSIIVGIIFGYINKKI